MKKIGITGGIGSGKTTICKVFEILGIPVYYSDAAAKSIMDNDKTVQQKVIDSFGDGILDNKKNIDKKKLANLVFHQPEKLKLLNSIIHPAVANDFNNWLTLQNSPYILKEAAIMFESGANKEMDKIIVVSSPQEIRIKRVVKRDNTTIESIEQRIKNQLPEEELIKKADFVIVNDENMPVVEQIIKIHEQLLNLP